MRQRGGSHAHPRYYSRPALLFTLAVSLLAGLLFGILPALRSTDLDLAAAVKDGARTGEGPRPGRARNVLIVAEVALTMMLMVGAGLLVRSYRALAGTDLGFVPEQAPTARISLPFARYQPRERRAVFYSELLERLRALPGVELVGSAQGIPFSGWDVQASMAVEGKPPRPKGEELDIHYQNVTPGTSALSAHRSSGAGTSPRPIATR